MTNKQRLGALTFLLYIGVVVGANLAIKHLAPVHVGFGQIAPASIYFVSAAMVLRDGVQRWIGKKTAILAVVIGALLSALWAGHTLAVASGVAFLASELVDFALFTALSSKRKWLGAVLVGGAAGVVVDSLIFLHLAFHSYAFLEGQLIGKGYGIAIAVLILAPFRARQAASQRRVVSTHHAVLSGN